MTQIAQNRRLFLSMLSSAACMSLIGGSNVGAQDERLETTTIRIAKIAGICIAPQYVADALLRAEGFTDIRYVQANAGAPAVRALVGGDIDFTANFSPPLIIPIDAGEPITIVAGQHVGCFELFAREGIRSIPDLKGKTVGVQGLGSSQYTFLSGMAAYVGLDPEKDIRWITSSSPSPMELFADGKIDAFLGLPPEPQELRARHIGRVLLDSTVDRPYSHYICCMLIGSRDYVRNYPVATKRVLRVILKANELCAAAPARAARRLVDGGFTDGYDYALQTVTELPYDKWREYDAEDTVRFYALRLREAGFIKSSPQKIIADGTDWRFLNELKRELKV